MAEVLSSGPDQGWESDAALPPRRPPPRWLSSAGAVLLALALTVLAVRDGTGRPRSAPEATEARPPAPAPRVIGTGAPERTGPPPAAAVHRLDGDPGAGPAGVRLLVGGSVPGVLDARTGLVTPLPGLRPPAGAVVGLRRGRGFTVALVPSRGEVASRAVLLPDAGGAVELGMVQDVLPMRDGTLLTTVCLAGTGGGCVVGSRTAAGEVRWSRRTRGGLTPLRDTPYGLLTLHYLDEVTGSLRLEDPRTGRAIAGLGRAATVLAATDRLIAWQADGCRSGCPVLVTDLAGGRQRVLPAAAGRPVSGAFSPDGLRLALGFEGFGVDDPDLARERDGYLAVLDLRRPGWIRAPGLTTGAGIAPLPVWTPAGDRLLIATGDGLVARVASWLPGDRRVTVVPVRLDGVTGRRGEFLLLA